MKKVKNKIITLCIGAAIAVSSLATPAFASTEDTLDGQVTVFHQGDVGDCGAVSAIQALDNSRFGKEFVMKLIKTNKDGSYTVKFKTGKIKVTKQDVENAYITGDLDARVIEAALQKAMNVYNSCFACDVFEKMTGFKQELVSGVEGRTKLLNQMAAKCYSYEGVTAACDFNIADDSKGIIGDGGHSYSIRSVINDYVWVINPWDTSNLILLPRSQFENSIRYMTYVDTDAKKVKVYWN